MMKKLIYIVVLYAINYSAKAQKIIDLDSVQVTSTRTKQKITQTGRNILVLDARQIENLPVNTIDELLRFLPGVEIQSRGGFGVQSDLTLRGSTFNQVLVLVNGVRINSPLTGHFNGYIPVPLAEIERVEVLKGTASSIYGSGAVGGVVNIITKNRPNNEHLDVMANVKMGSFGYVGSDVSVFSKTRKWQYSVGFQSNKSNGERFANPNEVLVSSAPKTYNTWFDNSIVSGSIGRALSNKWSIYLRSSYDTREFNAKFFYTASPYDESVEKTTLFFTDIKLSGENGKFKTDVNLVFQQSTDFFEFNPLFTANSHITRFGLIQFNQTYSITDKHNITYGFQSDLRAIKSNDRGIHENLYAGLYGQWLGNVFRNLTIVLAFRGDYDNNYQFELSPQLHVSYLYQKLVFRGGVGKGIRAADFTERYVSNNLYKLLAGRNLGNPDLAAETSWSYELGTDYYVNKNLKFVSTVFYRVSRNLIDYVPTLGNDILNVPVILVSNAEYLYSKNLGDVQTIGVEVEAWYQKTFSSGNVITVNFGYLGLESTSQIGTVSKYVSAHARHLINGNVTFKISRYSMGISGLYKDREGAYSRRLGFELEPSYFVMNTDFLVRIFDDKIQVKAQILNILNEHYSDIMGAPMPGRWWIVALGFTL